MSSFSKDSVSFKVEDASSTPHAFLLNVLYVANNFSKHLSMDESMDINILPSPMYMIYKYKLWKVQTVHLEHESYHLPSTFQIKTLSLLS